MSGWVTVLDASVLPLLCALWAACGACAVSLLQPRGSWGQGITEPSCSRPAGVTCVLSWACPATLLLHPLTRSLCGILLTQIGSYQWFLWPLLSSCLTPWTDHGPPLSGRAPGEERHMGGICWTQYIHCLFHGYFYNRSKSGQEDKFCGVRSSWRSIWLLGF